MAEHAAYALSALYYGLNPVTAVAAGAAKGAILGAGELLFGTGGPPCPAPPPPQNTPTAPSALALNEQITEKLDRQAASVRAHLMETEVRVQACKARLVAMRPNSPDYGRCYREMTQEVTTRVSYESQLDAILKQRRMLTNSLNTAVQLETTLQIAAVVSVTHDELKARLDALKHQGDIRDKLEEMKEMTSEANELRATLDAFASSSRTDGMYGDADEERIQKELEELEAELNPVIVMQPAPAPEKPVIRKRPEALSQKAT